MNASQIHYNDRIEGVWKRQTLAGRVVNTGPTVIQVKTDAGDLVTVCPPFVDQLKVNGKPATASGGAAPQPPAGAVPAPAPGNDAVTAAKRPALTALATGAAPVANADGVSAALTASASLVGSGETRLPSGGRGAEPRALTATTTAAAATTAPLTAARAQRATAAAPISLSKPKEDKTMAGHHLTKKTRKCCDCPAEYAPTSNRQIRCVDCAHAHKLEAERLKRERARAKWHARYSKAAKDKAARAIASAAPGAKASRGVATAAEVVGAAPSTSAAVALPGALPGAGAGTAPAGGRGAEPRALPAVGELLVCDRCGGYYRDGIDGQREAGLCLRCMHDDETNAEVAEDMAAGALRASAKVPGCVASVDLFRLIDHKIAATQHALSRLQITRQEMQRLALEGV